MLVGVCVMDNNLKPLVSVCMPTYRQEEYVALAMRGLLSQTYRPLEIVICDDASTDCTVEEIKRVIKSFPNEKDSEGHLIVNGINVRLVVNEKNLGGLKNYEKTFLLAEGDLIVDAGGDDIATPNRVERIVEAWITTGCKPTVIVHDGWRIDPRGWIIGNITNRRAVENALGAATAYVPDVVRKFPTISETGGYEDHVFGFRALMLGEECHLNEKLVYYRVGSGVSSVLMSHRPIDIKDAMWTISSAEQSLRDIEVASVPCSDTRRKELKNVLEDYLHRTRARLKMLSGVTVMERYSGYREIKCPMFSTGRMIQYVYLLPHWLCDFLLDGYLRLKYVFLRFRAKKISC